jgi:hypothetical protein
MIHRGHQVLDSLHYQKFGPENVDYRTFSQSLHRLSAAIRVQC